MSFKAPIQNVQRLNLGDTMRGFQAASQMQNDAADGLDTLITDLQTRNSQNVLAQLDNATTQEEAQKLRMDALSNGNLNQDLIKSSFDKTRARVQEQDRYNTNLGFKEREEGRSVQRLDDQLITNKLSRDNTEQNMDYNSQMQPGKLTSQRLGNHSQRLGNQQKALNNKQSEYTFDRNKNADTRTDVFRQQATELQQNALNAVPENVREFLDFGGTGGVNATALLEAGYSPSDIQSFESHVQNTLNGIKNLNAIGGLDGHNFNPNLPVNVEGEIRRALSTKNNEAALADAVTANSTYINDAFKGVTEYINTVAPDGSDKDKVHSTAAVVNAFMNSPAAKQINFTQGSVNRIFNSVKNNNYGTVFDNPTTFIANQIKDAVLQSNRGTPEEKQAIINSANRTFNSFMNREFGNSDTDNLTAP